MTFTIHFHISPSPNQIAALITKRKSWLGQDPSITCHTSNLHIKENQYKGFSHDFTHARLSSLDSWPRGNNREKKSENNKKEKMKGKTMNCQCIPLHSQPCVLISHMLLSLLRSVEFRLGIKTIEINNQLTSSCGSAILSPIPFPSTEFPTQAQERAGAKNSPVWTQGSQQIWPCKTRTFINNIHFSWTITVC